MFLSVFIAPPYIVLTSHGSHSVFCLCVSSSFSFLSRFLYYHYVLGFLFLHSLSLPTLHFLSVMSSLSLLPHFIILLAYISHYLSLYLHLIVPRQASLPSSFSFSSAFTFFCSGRFLLSPALPRVPRGREGDADKFPAYVSGQWQEQRPVFVAIKGNGD